MHRNTVPSGDKANDIIAGKRIAAFGELDLTVDDPIHDNRGIALFGRGGLFKLLKLLRGKIAGLLGVGVLDAGHQMREHQSPVADRSVQVIQ